MYRRPKFLEILLEIRQEMAREADYDVDLFAEMVRSGKFPKHDKTFDPEQKIETKKKPGKKKTKSKKLEKK